MKRSMRGKMQDRRLRLAGSVAVLLACTGCSSARNPVGGCPHEDVSLSEQDATPWGSAVGDDLEQLEGPYRGQLEWLDGDDVIEVPKAGESIEVEVTFALDPSSVVLREFIKEGDRVAACEPDEVLVDAEVAFVRADDGAVELEFPLEIRRTIESQQYFGEATISPPSSLTPGLEPYSEFETQAVVARFWWDPDGARVQATLRYSGQSSSGQSGQGAFRDVVAVDVSK